MSERWGELTADEKSQDMSLTAKRSSDSWSQNKNRDRLLATPVGPDVSELGGFISTADKNTVRWHAC